MRTCLQQRVLPNHRLAAHLALHLPLRPPDHPVPAAQLHPVQRPPPRRRRRHASLRRLRLFAQQRKAHTVGEEVLAVHRLVAHVGQLWDEHRAGQHAHALQPAMAAEAAEAAAARKMCARWGGHRRRAEGPPQILCSLDTPTRTHTHTCVIASERQGARCGKRLMPKLLGCSCASCSWPGGGGSGSSSSCSTPNRPEVSASAYASNQRSTPSQLAPLLAA